MIRPFPREALAAAGSRFEQANGNRIQLADFDGMMLHKLTRTDPADLADAICETIIAGGTDAEYRASAYFALGKKFDADQIPFFRERLRIELDHDELGAAYQIMIALDNLDEEVLAAERAGGSIIEQDLNRRDAESYLAGHG